MSKSHPGKRREHSMHQEKYLNILFSLIFYLSVAVSTQVSGAGAPESGPLSCVLESSMEEWPPFTYREQGRLTGMDTEIIEFIAREAGCTIIWKEMIWKRALQLLEIGKLAFVSGASITEERKKWGHYIPTSYRYETMSLFVRKNEAKDLNFKNISDIYAAKNFVLGITLDYFYGKEFNDLLLEYKKKIASEKSEIKDGVIISEANQDEKNYTKLVGRNKRISGFLGEKMATIRGLRDKDLLDKVEIHPLKINEDEVYLLFSKVFLESLKGSPNENLAKRFDDALKKHRQTNIQEIINSWEK